MRGEGVEWVCVAPSGPLVGLRKSDSKPSDSTNACGIFPNCLKPSERDSISWNKLTQFSINTSWFSGLSQSSDRLE
jgi:hypothetical protein